LGKYRKINGRRPRSIRKPSIEKYILSAAVENFENFGGIQAKTVKL